VSGGYGWSRGRLPGRAENNYRKGAKRAKTPKGCNSKSNSINAEAQIRRGTREERNILILTNKQSLLVLNIEASLRFCVSALMLLLLLLLAVVVVGCC
jgi:hypothetical protein